MSKASDFRTLFSIQRVPGWGLRAKKRKKTVVFSYMRTRARLNNVEILGKNCA